jgi:hypothetical protein
LIHNKWVYKIKRKPDGSIDRCEASLIVKGFDQRSGIDYTETFSSVIKPATIQLVLALVVQFDCKVKQLDVSNAFLHWTLEEDVAMEQPQGFVDPQFPTFVCKLHMALYGLKQAPRAWFNRLSLSLQTLGFLASLVDSCNAPIKTNLFIRQNLFQRSSQQWFSIIVFNETQNP